MFSASNAQLKSRASFGLGLLVVFASVIFVSAASYVKTSLRDLTTRAVAVAEIEVVARQYPAMKDGQSFPRTHVQAKVIRTLKGSLPEWITLDIPGGIHNDTVGYIADGVEFKTGERALVFLKNSGDEAPQGSFMVQDLGLGKFNLVERNQQRFVESPLCPHAMDTPSVAGKNTDLEADLLMKSVPYDSFCQLVDAYALGKTPDINVITLAAGLPFSTAHHHLDTPAAVTDLHRQRIENSETKSLWMVVGSVLLIAMAALGWVLYRRKKKTSALQVRSVLLLLSGSLLIGAGVGVGSHAFVPFNQNTIWDLDTPITGKVAGQKVIWKQSTSVSTTNASVFSGVQASYDAWALITGSRLSFTAGGSTSKSTNDSNDAENIVAWSSSLSSDFSSSTLAITFSSFTIGTKSSFVDGDIIFNDRDFSWSASGQGNATSVSLHEIGHFIGLNHTTDKNTVMFPFDQGLTALKPDEILAAQTLYPGTNPGGGSTNPAAPTVTASGSSTQGLPPLAVTFTATATSGNTGSAIVTQTWDFGDGSTGSGANVSHTYTAAGTYEAIFTATDAAGLSTTTSILVQVGAEGSVLKGAFKLNFKFTGKDSFSTTIASSALIAIKSPRGTGTLSQGTVTIGDQATTFSYDTEKGRSANSTTAPKVMVNDRTGTVTIMMRNSNLATTLSAYGATNADTSGVSMTVPVSVWLGSGKDVMVYASVTFTYSAKVGKFGGGKH